jgi:hypothetical protein
MMSRILSAPCGPRKEVVGERGRGNCRNVFMLGNRQHPSRRMSNPNSSASEPRTPGMRKRTIKLWSPERGWAQDSRRHDRGSRPARARHEVESLPGNGRAKAPGCASVSKAASGAKNDPR